MKLCSLLLLISLSLFCVGQPVVASDDAEDSPLHEAMEVMGKNLRKLKRQVDDPEKVESSKEILATMKTAAEKAKGLEPHSEKEMTETEHAKWIARYKERMQTVIDTIDQTEKALAEGKFDVGKEKVAALGQERKEGHEEFEVSDD